MRESSAPAAGLDSELPLEHDAVANDQFVTASATIAPGGRIGGRYLVQQELGRGGMAIVYRVLDPASGQRLALKQLAVPERSQNRAAMLALFEHEFRTLAELDHPRVIHVDDYGIDARGAYYTMELLDGGNLTQRSPLPYREACALIHDVCSSLALLHSRRLIHRDVSPHNVRCTQAGRAKLIDFGAMVQMGPCLQAVGTPAFVAPEVAHRGTLDARTDLFSLGATLYFALTGRPAYPARSFAQLLDVWSQRPAPPSAYSAEIPPRLDELVMAMLSLDPALRPRSAFEVMSQLNAIAKLEQHEVIEVSRVYLASPRLIGRTELLEKAQRRMTRARLRRGSGLLIEGPAGGGRSRALAALALQGKIAGLAVVHDSAKAAGKQPFALATRLLRQLVHALPDASFEAARTSEGAQLLFEPVAARNSQPPTAAPKLKPLSEELSLRSAQQQALTQFCLQLARHHTLAFAVDDLDDADESSGAWLAALADRAKRHRLLLLYTARSASLVKGTNPILDVVAERCSRVTLAPLTAAQLQELCDSIFGDVPNVGMCADRVYRVAVGNPRACMDLLRHLVERELISYDGGSWILPAQLDANALPASMDQSYAERVTALSNDARWLGQAHALSLYLGLSRADHALLMAAPDASASDQATDELIGIGALEGQDRFRIADEAWTRALLSPLTAAQRAEIHARLAQLGRGADRPVLAIAYHWQLAGQPVRALDELTTLLSNEDVHTSVNRMQLPVSAVCTVLHRAHDTALELNRSEFEINELRRWLYGLTIATLGEPYERVGAAWLAALRRDSGLDDWEALADVADPGQRLMQALQRATERHQNTPEPQRGYPPDAAIKHLINYVVISIVVTSRAYDAVGMRSLPRLLEPFAVLSPIIEAIRQNALATYECAVEGRFHRARERWLSVLERLRDVKGEELRYVGPIRRAIAFVLGVFEMARGAATVDDWAALLDEDELQAVSAMYLRRLARLQLGDTEGAERFRRQAELLAVTAHARQMFDATLLTELFAHGMAGDLTGLRHVGERMRLLAEHCPGWLPYHHLAEAQLALLHGEFTQALKLTSQALVLCTPDDSDPRRCCTPWTRVAAAHAQALFGLGRFEDAKRYAQGVLDECAARDLTATDEVVRALAHAEAKLGEHEKAAERLTALIAHQEAAGTVGVHLGASYEARTRIAIWAGDRAAVDKYGKLTAQAYAHGQGSPLGARYERLMNEARTRGVSVLPELTQFESTMFGTIAVSRSTPNAAMVGVMMRSAATSDARADRALQLVCEATGARAGQLYLVGERGLMLAAAIGDPHQTTAHHELAREFLDRACSDDVGATEIVSESGPGTSTAGSWAESRPMLHRAILLTGEHEHKTLHAAVVVVDSPAARATTREVREMFAAIATQLLVCGDTRGVAAND